MANVVEVRSVSVHTDPKLKGQQTEFDHSQDRLKAAKLLGTLSIVSIGIAAVQIILSSLHIYWDRITIAKFWLAFGIVYAGASAAAFLWAKRAAKNSDATPEFFKPADREGSTRLLFITALVLSCTGLVLLVNSVSQYDFRADYVTAYETHPNPNVWKDRYGSLSANAIKTFLQVSFIVHCVASAWFTFFFVWAAKTQFDALKSDHQAITYLVFVASILLLSTGFALSYIANHDYNYIRYVIIHNLFPTWNVRSLYVMGFVMVVISILTFLTAHRNWRVGYLVHTFFTLFALIILANFTGYAFNHSKMIYNHYSGAKDLNTCVNRLAVVDWRSLDAYGCPQKYLPNNVCNSTQRTAVWEDEEEPQPAKESNSTKLLLVLSAAEDPLMNGLLHTVEGNVTACVNTGCCGIQGQLYAHDFFALANTGLLVILSCLLILVGCGYFWYISWVDVARDKQGDYPYFAVLGVCLVVGIVLSVTHAIPIPYVREKLNTYT